MNRAVSGRSTARPWWIRSAGRVNPESVPVNSLRSEICTGPFGGILRASGLAQGGSTVRVWLELEIDVLEVFDSELPGGRTGGFPGVDEDSTEGAAAFVTIE